MSRATRRPSTWDRALVTKGWGSMAMVASPAWTLLRASVASLQYSMVTSLSGSMPFSLRT